MWRLHRWKEKILQKMKSQSAAYYVATSIAAEHHCLTWPVCNVREYRTSSFKNTMSFYTNVMCDVCFYVFFHTGLYWMLLPFWLNLDWVTPLHKPRFRSSTDHKGCVIGKSMRLCFFKGAVKTNFSCATFTSCHIGTWVFHIIGKKLNVWMVWTCVYEHYGMSEWDFFPPHNHIRP